MSVQLRLENYLRELKDLIAYLEVLKTKYPKIKERLIQDLEIDLANLKRLIELEK